MKDKPTTLRMKQSELVKQVDTLIAKSPMLQEIQSMCNAAHLPKNVMLMIMLLNVNDLLGSAERALQRSTKV